MTCWKELFKHSNCIVFLTLVSMVTSTGSHGILCHDCTGLEECSSLVKHRWTGKCRAQADGKCFIRKDPNGIIYRGCADPFNWPQLDFGYNGCKEQTYGWWGQTPVLWCFCNFDLCNVNISFVISSYSNTEDGNQNGGQEFQSGIDETLIEDGIDENSGKLEGNWLFGQTNRLPGSQGSQWYWAVENHSGGGSLPRPPSVFPSRPSQPTNGNIGIGGLSFRDWNDILRYLEKIKLINSQQGGLNIPPLITYPSKSHQSTARGKYFHTTTAPLNGLITARPTWPPKTFSPGIFYPTPFIPIQPLPPSPPLYKIPDELLKYLIENLPKDPNDIRSVPYPVYVILYLLSVQGVNITSLSGFNFTGWNFPPIPPVIPYVPIDPRLNSSQNLACRLVQCEQYCEYVNDGPHCRCRSGFLLDSDLKSCHDINECSINGGGCSQVCINTIGAYYCTCSRNFELLSDQRTCRDIDECLINNGGCSDTCSNLPGSYVCSCRPGTYLGRDNRTCYSVNDCTLPNQQRCSQRCNSAQGGITCACFQGYILDNDGQTCNDINECAVGTSGCSQTCTNTVGSYTCQCRPGYRLANARDCTDINECLQNNGGCSQRCVNTVGSYRCECESGYYLSSTDLQTCNDVNECLSNNGGCRQNCTNTIGSHFCGCFGGLQIQADGKSCAGGGCPQDFIQNSEVGSCYKIFSPNQLSNARTVAQARDRCRQLHPYANLVSVETTKEQVFLSGLLSREQMMLEGWQGWWTSGSYQNDRNQFYWGNNSTLIDSSFWGFQRPPFKDTCVWILQIPNYNYTLGNYDCFTASGYVCEITELDILNDP